MSDLMRMFLVFVAAFVGGYCFSALIKIYRRRWINRKQGEKKIKGTDM
jgi:hypothetical protein